MKAELPTSRRRAGDPARLRAVLAVLATVSGACRPASHTAVIGLGYLTQQRAALLAVMVADSTSTRGLAIQLTSAMPGWARPNSQAVAEVDWASRLAALPGIVGVVGPGGSREALESAPVYREAHVPLIVPTATSRLLRDAGP